MASVAARLAALRGRGLNYDPDAPHPPDEGWRIDDYREPLPREAPGPPVDGGPFAVAQALLRDYKVADPRIVRAYYDEQAPLEGRDMLLELRFLLFRTYAGCRVGDVVDGTREVDGRPVRVWGWPYRTLEGHVEQGEMSWEVWKWLDTGDVEFRIHSYSRLTRTPNPFTRLAMRLFGQHERRRYLSSAGKRVAELTADALRGRYPDGPAVEGGRVITTARRIGAATLVGVACGMRTFTGPAALAVRGRIRPGWGRAALVAAAAGEAVGDKTPFVPPRTSPPPLAGRIASGALSGRAVAGVPGAAAGALGAVAGALGGQRARSGLGRLTGLPDALLAVVEDGAAVTAAALATRDPRTPDPDSFPARAGLGAARGAVAGVAATTAMTAAQLTLQKATGASSSRTPERAARTVIRRLSSTDVPRDRRDTLNDAAHWLYGTAWGVGLGVTAAARRGRPRVAAAGAGLALVAWAASPVELPALGVAAPAWKQSPASVASDAGLRLLYGLTAAAVLELLP